MKGERSDCARFASLTDRMAVEESVSRADQVFVREHAATCGVCASEAGLYARLESYMGDEPAALQPEGPALSTRRSQVATAASFVAMAAAVLLVLRDGAPSRPVASTGQPAATTSPEPPDPAATLGGARATVLLREGEGFVDGQPALAGSTLAEGATLSTGHGRLCVGIDPGVRACLGEGTRVRVEHLASSARVLRLERGRVASELEPQPPGTSYSVAAGGGVATAIGTAFSVEQSDAGPFVTRVTHGVVLVRDGSDSRQVRAHERTRGGEAARPLTTDEEGVDRALLRDSVSDVAGARLTLDTTPPGAEVRLDGVSVGETPLDLLVAEGAHALEVEGLAEAQSILLGPHEHLTKSWARVAPVTSTAAVRPPAPASPAPVAPGALLASAQGHRSRGEVDLAAADYRALVEAYPASAEAGAAGVSLGELELSRGAASEALAWFERYLAVGGPLVLEARFGRIRALGRLGQGDREREAAEAFLRDYPDSPQADALRAGMRR